MALRKKNGCHMFVTEKLGGIVWVETEMNANLGPLTNGPTT